MITGFRIDGLEKIVVLTWVSIYWFSTAGPTASMRIYYERANNRDTSKPPTIPHGVSYFPKELYHAPRLWWSNPSKLGKEFIFSFRSRAWQRGAFCCPRETCRTCRRSEKNVWEGRTSLRRRSRQKRILSFWRFLDRVSLEQGFWLETHQVSPVTSSFD